MPKSLLNTLKKTLPQLGAVVTKAELLAAKLNLEAQHTQLIRDIRVAGLENKEAEKNELIQQKDAIDRFVALIEFCLDYYKNKEDESQCLYSLTLDWLLKNAPDPDEETFCIEIYAVLNAFFDNNAPKALAYYASKIQFEDILENFKNTYPAVKAEFDLTLVKFFLKRATELLALQSPSAGIIPLLQALMGEPHQFAALLIWAVNQGISPAQLIKSSLLHDFIQSYIHLIGTNNNPVEQVFHWLKTLMNNEKYSALITDAQTVSCVKVTQKNKGFAKYSLTGEINDELTEMDPNIPELALTLTYENILNLYCCFDSYFLQQALYLLSKAPNQPLEISLKKLFDESEYALNQLPELIKSFSREDVVKKESLFRSLSMVVSDETAQAILKKTTAILHLIQYKPSLIGDFSENDLNHFIDRIITSSDFAFEKLAQLMVLFEFLEKLNYLYSKIVFDKILDVALSNANLVLGDGCFVNKLKNHIKLNRLPLKKRSFYQQTLNDFIALNTIESLERSVYDAIEDHWSEQLTPVKLLEVLVARQVVSYPRDKYALKVEVIKSCCQQQKDGFDLIKTIDEMTTIHGGIDQINGEKERTYVEFLLATEDENLLKKIVDELYHTLKIENWQDKEYGNKSLLYRAMENENIRLLNYFFNLPFFQFKVASKLIIDDAVYLKKWRAVLFFCGLAANGKLDKTLLLEILKENRYLKENNLILRLCEFLLEGDFTKETLVAELIVKMNRYRFLDDISCFLCALIKEKVFSEEMSEFISHETLNMAAEISALDVMQLLFDLNSPHVFNQSHIELALKKACERAIFNGRGYKAINFFCQLTSSNKPSLAAIIDALNSIADNKDATHRVALDTVEKLCTLLIDDEELYQKAILIALDKALKSMNLPLITLLQKLNPGKNEPILDLIQTGTQLVSFLKKQKDEYDPWQTINDLGTDRIKCMIQDGKQLGLILQLLPVERHLLFIEALGNDYIQNILPDGTQLGKVLKSIDTEEWPTFINALDDELIQAILFDGEQLGKLLKMFAMRFKRQKWPNIISALGNERIRAILSNANGAQLGLFLDSNNVDELVNFLGLDCIKSIIHNGHQVGLLLNSLLRAPDEYSSSMTRSWWNLTDLFKRHIQTIFENGYQLSCALKQLPIDTWQDLKIANGYKPLLLDWQQLVSALKELPVDQWPVLIAALGKERIQTIIASSVELERVLSSLATVDELHLIKALSSVLGEDYVNERRKKTVDSLNRITFFAEPQKQNAPTVIPVTHCEGPPTLSLQKSAISVREQRCFSEVLCYLIDKHTKLMKGKVKPPNFKARLDDFCHIITLLAKFFTENRGNNPSDKTLKDCIAAYITGEGIKMTENIQRTGSIFMGFSTSSDKYIGLRDFLLTINVETLRARFEAFQASVIRLTVDNTALPSARAVAEKIKAAFEAGEFRDENQLGSNIIWRNSNSQ